MSAVDAPLDEGPADIGAFRRRTLLLGAVAGLGATAVASVPRPAVAARAGGRTPAARGAYAVAAWRPLVGATLRSPRGPVLVTSLVQREETESESFQLRFEATDARPMPEQLVVVHPHHGSVTFLVTTVGARGVAVVNRRRS